MSRRRRRLASESAPRRARPPTSRSRPLRHGDRGAGSPRRGDVRRACRGHGAQHRGAIARAGPRRGGALVLGQRAPISASARAMRVGRCRAPRAGARDPGRCPLRRSPGGQQRRQQIETDVEAIREPSEERPRAGMASVHFRSATRRAPAGARARRHERAGKGAGAHRGQAARPRSPRALGACQPIRRALPRARARSPSEARRRRAIVRGELAAHRLRAGDGSRDRRRARRRSARTRRPDVAPRSPPTRTAPAAAASASRARAPRRW
jgi:hypothetical protein